VHIDADELVFKAVIDERFLILSFLLFFLEGLRVLLSEFGLLFLLSLRLLSIQASFLLGHHASV
jgi:hypothetical protein